ncbi:MAG: type II toxin-antitoxin system HipA family toxin [Coriobacteriales bacterium]|jgi:serine/threonine-protein kinase HipA|nr:type II toxin-antitoxin system HipA family toxin [Coriobacteriales bacterium]
MVYEPVNSIEVICWDVPVGALAFDARYGVYAFEYYESFRQSGWELSPLLLPLSTSGAVVFPNLSRETYFGLPAFIADSLPDAFGNMLIDSWMASQGISRNQITSLDRLAYLGTRAMGALEFRPALRRESTTASALAMSELVETARQALIVNLRQDRQNPDIALVVPPEGGAALAVPLEGREIAHAVPPEGGAVLAEPSEGRETALLDTSPTPQSELAQLIAIGTSAGGARAKAVVGFNPQTEDFISGQFHLPQGFEPWIIKFDLSAPGEAAQPGRKQAYGRIEYAYYLMAQDAGLDMQPCRLYEAASRAHFMTRRFDRTPAGHKLHMQTLCAMTGLDFNLRDTHDYNQAFMTIEELGLGYQTTDQLFRRMTFNVAMANNDDHTKNLSFIMSPTGQWQLAPAYDLIHAYNPQGQWTSRHLMSVNGKYSNITKNDLLAVAERFHVSAPKDIIDSILAIATEWPFYAKTVYLPVETTAIVGNDISHCSELLH